MMLRQSIGCFTLVICMAFGCKKVKKQDQEVSAEKSAALSNKKSETVGDTSTRALDKEIAQSAKTQTADPVSIESSVALKA